MVGTGANRTPLTKVHPILLGQKKSEGDGILARHRQQHQERLQQQRPDGLPSGWGQGQAPVFSSTYYPTSMHMPQPPLPNHFQPPMPGMPPGGFGGPPPPPPADYDDKPRRKRSRWGDPEDKSALPGLPAALPASMTEEQRKHFLLHFKIEEITQKLRSGDLGIPSDPAERSPSPEPIYNSEGKRLNTREFRVRKKLEEERHTLIKQAIDEIPTYKPPADYKPPPVRVHEKVFIPQDKNPAINFIGLLIGPRGNTLKKMETETGCKIIIRGKGSVKEGKGRIAGQPMPGEDEPLHAMVTGPTEKDVKHAVEVIRKIIKEGVECPDAANELRRNQLRELAALNGTLIEEDLIKCKNCGALDHRHWECQEQKNVTSQIVCNKCGGYGHVASDCKVLSGDSGVQLQQTFAEKAKMDNEYLSLMAELGVDTPPPAKKFDGPMSTNMPSAPSGERVNFNRPADGVSGSQNKWGPPANAGGLGPRTALDMHGSQAFPQGPGGPFLQASGGQAPPWASQGAPGSNLPRPAMQGQGGIPPWQAQQRGLAPGLPNPGAPVAGFPGAANNPVGYPGQGPFGGNPAPWQRQIAPLPHAAYPQTWSQGLPRPMAPLNYGAYGQPAHAFQTPLTGSVPPWAQQPPPPPPPPPAS